MKLEGTKTYIFGVMILAAAIVGASIDLIDGQTCATLIAIALTAMGIRHGIHTEK